MSRQMLVSLLLLVPFSLSADELFTKPSTADVPALVAYLHDANLRQGASNALATIGQGAVEQLAESLKSDDLNVAIWSAYTLGKIGSAAAPAAAGLSEALESPDKDLRAVAARSLGQIRTADPSTIAALASSLLDEDSRVRQRAATALGEIGPAAKAAVPALIAALADDAVRSRALKSLTQIGPAAVSALTAALDNHAIRLEAAAAIRAIDPAAARSAGVEKITRDELAALAMSIANPHKQATARIEHVNCLGQLGADAAPYLIAVFDDDAIEVSRAASSALRQIGSDALPALQEALRHESPRVRSASADALAAIGHAAEPAVADLGRLLSDPDRSVRYRAAFALDQLGSVADAAVPALIAAMNDTREMEATRQMAIKALSQTGPATHDTVLKALRQVNDQGNFGVRNLAGEMLERIEREWGAPEPPTGTQGVQN